jgi:hypothetical protein
MSILTVLNLIIRYKKLIISSIAVVFIVLSYSYYRYSQKKIQYLREENQNLQQSLIEKDAYIKNLKVAYEIIQKSKNEVNQSVIQSFKEIENLKKRLNRENSGKTSIANMAKVKPKLIEKIINDSLNKTLACFEDTSNQRDCDASN